MSLLSVVGKVPARVLLRRLLTHVVDIVPESQCGFRRQFGTTDMLSVARLLQEKCREQHKSLYLVFIDLTKAFDTVNRPLLWSILSICGCTPHFLAVLREIHDGITAKIVVRVMTLIHFLSSPGLKKAAS